MTNLVTNLVRIVPGALTKPLYCLALHRGYFSRSLTWSRFWSSFHALLRELRCIEHDVRVDNRRPETGGLERF